MTTIKVENLTYSIPQVGIILKNISFETHPGQFIGILGENGQGKSTLLDLLLGFRTPQEGCIKILDEDPYLESRQNKERISYISQDIELKGDLTIREALLFHRTFYPNYDIKYEQELCKLFKLKTTAKISSLSTGFQKRFQIVAGLASRPKVIIIDEITAVLDPAARSLFFNILKSYKEEHQATILMATNLAEDLEGYADQILHLEDSFLTEVKPEEFFSLFAKSKVG